MQEVPRAFEMEKVRDVVEFNTAFPGSEPDLEGLVRGVDLEIHGIVPDDYLSFCRVDGYWNGLFGLHGAVGRVAINGAFRHFHILRLHGARDDFAKSERMDFCLVSVSHEHFEQGDGPHAELEPFRTFPVDRHDSALPVKSGIVRVPGTRLRERSVEIENEFRVLGGHAFQKFLDLLFLALENEYPVGTEEFSQFGRLVRGRLADGRKDFFRFLLFPRRSHLGAVYRRRLQLDFRIPKKRLEHLLVKLRIQGPERFAVFPEASLGKPDAPKIPYHVLREVAEIADAGLDEPGFRTSLERFEIVDVMHENFRSGISGNGFFIF